MKTFKEFLLLIEGKNPKLSPDQERANAKISKLINTKSNGWSITASTHAKSRAVEHHPSKGVLSWDKLHNKVTKHLNDDLDTADHTGVYFSKSLNHGYAVAVTRNDPTKPKNVHLINVLENGKHRATHEGDREVILESIVYNYYEID